MRAKNEEGVARDRAQEAAAAAAAAESRRMLSKGVSLDTVLP